ncbi:hypothetical protein BN996_01765 [Haloferax massiliensis]|uniref:Uncharacterized protein n=1 Tax=Haloferax massiliensis TaxID=1476858 RepID=A0A0D6JRJ8_9EURY|nr:hypothetical protein BN996_01765 [Haloferax massiliensis]
MGRGGVGVPGGRVLDEPREVLLFEAVVELLGLLFDRLVEVRLVLLEPGEEGFADRGGAVRLADGDQFAGVAEASAEERRFEHRRGLAADERRDSREQVLVDRRHRLLGRRGVARLGGLGQRLQPALEALVGVVVGLL